MKQFKIGIQLYILREQMQNDMEATLAAVKAMGYDYVEFAGYFGKSAEEVRALLDKYGLTAISVHQNPDDFITAGQPAFDYLNTIGAKYCAIPWYNLGEFTENWDATIAKFQTLGEQMKANSLQLLYHNHDFEFMTIDGKYALDILYERVPADLLQTELDTCWVNVGGEVPADYIKKYAGRCPVVHLKDFYGEKSDDMYELIGIDKKAPARPSGFEFRPVGSGMQDFPAIVKAAKESGAEWVVVEQDKPSMGLTPMECAKKSIDYVKSII